MRAFIVSVVTVTLFAACQKNEAAPAAATNPGKVAAPAAVQNGVQTVKITVSDMGYAPGSVELKAGVPTKLIFEQQSKSHCAAQVQIPSQGVKVTDLPFGKETVVEFTPKESGTFTFACGMDMMKGTIVVKS